MNRLIVEIRKTSGTFTDGPVFKERRKAYYHGKYNKKMLLVLLFISSAALIVFRLCV